MPFVIPHKHSQNYNYACYFQSHFFSSQTFADVQKKKSAEAIHPPPLKSTRRPTVDAINLKRDTIPLQKDWHLVGLSLEISSHALRIW